MGLTADETSGRDRRHAASRLIRASASDVYDAWVKPDRLIRWLPPDGATAEIELFEPCAGGRFKLILTFTEYPGKSSAGRDVVQGRFRELLPYERIVQQISFESDKPEFAGVMTMTWSFTQTEQGTWVTIVAEDVPPGVQRAEHENAMAGSLSNLARLLE
jgi:uncharacterized protein YndB with AHSA1/START domain